MMILEWKDEKEEYPSYWRADVTHHIDGKDCALGKYMLELQLGHGDNPILFDTHDQRNGWGSMRYLMTPEQARKLIDVFDGVRYEDSIEFVSHARIISIGDEVRKENLKGYGREIDQFVHGG